MERTVEMLFVGKWGEAVTGQSPSLGSLLPFDLPAVPALSLEQPPHFIQDEDWTSSEMRRGEERRGERRRGLQPWNSHAEEERTRKTREGKTGGDLLQSRLPCPPPLFNSYSRGNCELVGYLLLNLAYTKPRSEW